MKRHMLFYLFLSVTLIFSVFGALPLAAAGTLNAPAGFTETPTLTPTLAPTETLVPTATSAPTETPVPTATSAPTNTPAAALAPTETHVPVATHALVPTSTPTAPTVVGLPNTGGAGPQARVSVRILVWMAGIVGGLSALAVGLKRRAYQPSRR